MPEDGQIKHDEVKQRLAALLVPEKFKAWLEARKAEQLTVGLAGRSRFCPIAQYLEDQNEQHPSIRAWTISVFDGPVSIDVDTDDLQPWLRRFINLIDRHNYARSVTADRALDVLADSLNDIG